MMNMRFGVLICTMVILSGLVICSKAPADNGETLNLSVVSSGLDTILSWNTVKGATGYRLFWAPFPNPVFVDSADLGNITSLRADLWDGAALYVAVGAYNASDLTALSNIDTLLINLKRNYVLGWRRDDFVAEHHTYWQRDWRLESVSAYMLGGQMNFNAVWQSASAPNNYVLGWRWNDFIAENEKYWNQNWVLHALDTVVVNQEVLFNAVWRPRSANTNYVLGWNRTDFDRENEKYWNQGWRLDIIDSYVLNNQVYFNAVWREGRAGFNYVIGWQWQDFIRENETYWNQGWRLATIDTYILNNQVYVNAVWREGNRDTDFVLGWLWDDFVAENERRWNNDWELHAIDSYIQNNQVRFNAVWRKRASLRPAGVCGYSEWLPQSRRAPYGAVGFISNGCTATLIDSQHILTGAHCIVMEGDNSRYATDLWFYPNYNGSQLLPPRFRIERAVVGAHGETCCSYITSDWAIARLDTPATGFPALSLWARTTSAMDAVVAHYTRDKMLFGKNCVQPFSGCDCGGNLEAGETACVCAPPPYSDEYGCTAGWKKAHNNVWWQNGLVSHGRVRHDTSADYSIVTGVSGGGGASGSPHLVRDEGGAWRIIGVTHGANCNEISGPWAGRFIEAPRFAASVAVASSPTAGNRTGVFVLDADTGRVLMRDRRAGSDLSGSVLQPFTYYQTVSDAPDGSTRLSAFKQPDTGWPSLITLTTSGNLFESAWNGQAWGAWQQLPAPPAGRFLDLDAATDASGVPTLFAVSDTAAGGLYRIRRTAFSPHPAWSGPWTQLASNTTDHTMHRVTAIRHHGDGLNQVWVLSANGRLQTLRETAAGSWTPVSDVSLPVLQYLETIVDLDAAWGTAQTAILTILTSRGQVWFREATTTQAHSEWSSWTLFPATVDPGVPINRSGVRLTSLNASRWQETGSIIGAASIVPVVFATDNWGNVFQTTRRSHNGTLAWSNWMPFYGKRIDAVQTIQD